MVSPSIVAIMRPADPTYNTVEDRTRTLAKVRRLPRSFARLPAGTRIAVRLGRMRYLLVICLAACHPIHPWTSLSYVEPGQPIAVGATVEAFASWTASCQIKGGFWS